MSSQAPSWLNQAELVPSVLVEVGFVVHETLYTGPENEFTQEQWRNSRERLYQPNIRRNGHFAFSSDIADHTYELARYYQDVIAKASAQGQTTEMVSHCFWNRPVIYYPDGFTLGFPWYDRFREGRRLFDAICSTECDGEVFSDIDQGWELVLWLQGGVLYASESDPDDEAVRQSFKFAHQPVKSQIAELIPRVERIISTLSDRLGHDYWS